MYPFERLRRYRRSKTLREIFSETDILPKNLMYPVFVKEGKTEEIKLMPGIKRYSLEDLLKELEVLVRDGLKSVLLFGIPPYKDETGSYALKKDGIVQKTIREIKKKFDIVVAADVCLCGYKEDGHCGIVKDGEIDNDETLKYLQDIALSYAECGVDIVAPSDMMDGRVKAIREALEKNGFHNTLIMAYSIKFASNFYGPFRDAMHSQPKFGDRKTHQINPTQKREAIREALLDIEEGADIIMVKPAIFYLDIIQKIREITHHPIAAYFVSGEYSILKIGVQSEVIEKEAIYEAHIAVKRAGADIIISYFTPEILKMG